MFDGNGRLLGISNLLPAIELVGDVPRDIENTIYHRSLDGATHFNSWNFASVYDTWTWKQGGRYTHSLPGNVGYYLYDKDLYAWLYLARDWEEAAAKLIKLKYARSAKEGVIAELATDAVERHIQAEKSKKAKINRVSKLDWEVTRN